jgi:hypothetical protein
MTHPLAAPWQDRLVAGVRLGDVVDVSVFIVAVIVGAAIVYRIGRTLIRRAAVPGHVLGDEARARAETARALLLSVWKYVVILGVGVVLVSRLHGALAPTVAVTSAVGLTIAFGAQWLFKDVIAGFSILMEGQLAVGDRVRLYGVETEGTVDSVGLRITVIRDDDGSRVFVPNGAITAIRNLGAATAAESAEAPRTRARRGGRGRGPRRDGEPPAESAPPAARRRESQRTGQAVSVTVPEGAERVPEPAKRVPEPADRVRAVPERAEPAPSAGEPIFELPGGADQDRAHAPARPRTRRGGRGRPRRPSRRPTGTQEGEAGASDVEPSAAIEAAAEPAAGRSRARASEPDDMLEESPWSIE